MFRRRFFYSLIFCFSLTLYPNFPSNDVFGHGPPVQETDAGSVGPEGDSPSNLLSHADPNKGFEIFLVALRGGAIGTLIVWGLTHQPDSVALMASVAVGATAGSGSAFLQLKHIPLTYWYRVKGFFKLSETKRASFLESLLKGYIVGLAHIYPVHIVSTAFHLKAHYLSVEPLKSALEGLMTTLWTIFNSKLTDRMILQFPHRHLLIWRASRVGAALISILGTYGIVMRLHQAPIGDHILYWMGGTGAVANIVLSNIDRLGRCASWLRNLKRKNDDSAP